MLPNEAESDQDWMLPSALTQIDSVLLASLIGRPPVPTSNLIRGYLRHVGFRKYQNLKLLRLEIQKSVGPEAFDTAWRIAKHVIHARLGEEIYPYLENIQAVADATIIILNGAELAESCIGFPDALSYVFRQKFSPALKMYSSHSSILYCDVHNYQIYSLDRALIWKSASPFSLTRSIENAKRMAFDGPVVYIGDIFDGSNFSHFLFDHMTRLGLCIDRHFKNKLCSVDALTFISSGIPTEFHNRVADAVCTVYGLRRKQIVFPNSPTNILSLDAIYWFSDSYEIIFTPHN